MKVALVSSGFPPDLDGIGDYTFWLAKALEHLREAGISSVRVYTRHGDYKQVERISVQSFFQSSRSRSIQALESIVERDAPDCLIVQYNPFAWGRRGYCPELPKTLRSIKRRPGAPRIAVMFHELFTEDSGWKNRLMMLWQMAFSAEMARLADVGAASCESYVRWLRARGLPAVTLPVGSNLPDSSGSRITGAPSRLYCGTFGFPHASRRIDLIADAVAAVRGEGIDAHFVFVGAGGEEARLAFERLKIPFRATGSISAERAANEIANLQLYLAPFTDGLSARRGSVMSALKEGVPVVSSIGYRTDSFLKEAHEKALILADTDAEFVTKVQLIARDSGLRNRIGLAGQNFYSKRLDWPVIAESWLNLLRESL